MTDRVERLTNLLALLLETREPLSLVEIAGELRDQYPAGTTARRAAFERDKAALRSIGVPIEQEIVTGGAYAGQTRYWIDRKMFELGDIGLEADEMRALQVAMAATRPGSSTGQEALWKLGGEAESGGVPVTAVVPDLDSLPVLRDAVTRRRPVSFRYRDAERTLDPWGLLLRDGFWYVTGHDHDRGERRTFRVDRIVGDVTVLDGPVFDRPAGFDAREAIPEDPKLIGVGADAEVAMVRVSAARAPFVVRDVGEDRVVERRDDGSVVVEVVCANRPAFRSWVLGFLDHAEVIGPTDVRDEIVAWLEGVVA